MAEEKKKRERFMTPKGVAKFPWLQRPDTKFKAEGEYSVELLMDRDAAQPLIDKLQPQFDAVLKAAQKDPKRKGKKLTVHDFWRAEVDDDGNETGRVSMKFKALASGVSKKDGKPWTRTINLFDAKGEKLDPAVRVFGGSILKVSFTANAFDKPIGLGLSLRIEAVQVLKAVSGGGDAKSYGFSDESEDEDADTPEENDEGGEGDDEGEGSGGDF